MNNMEELCDRVQTCYYAYSQLKKAKVSRSTWNGHPFLKRCPENLLWFAIAVGVDPKWVGAALLWAHSIAPKHLNPADAMFSQEEVKRLAGWIRGKNELDPQPGQSHAYGVFVSLVRSAWPKYIANELLLTLPWNNAKALHKALLQALPWEVVKKAMIDNGFGDCLDE